MASNFTQSQPSRITSYMVNQLQPTAQETKVSQTISDITLISLAHGLCLSEIIGAPTYIC